MNSLSVLLAASFLALAVVEERSHAEPVSRNDGRISVIVGESGDIGPTPRLLVMDADGTHERLRLGWVYDAAFSPDGLFIAYRPAATREIRVVSAARGGRDRLLVRNGRDLDWSPNGETVAFARDRGGCCDQADVWIEDLHSRKQRPVVRDAQQPDWSPDGRELAFVRRSDVWVVNIGSRSARRLVRDAEEPRWSPAGGRIAFVRDRGYDSSVFVAHADGTAARRVIEGESAAWSPDGSELAIGQFRRVVRIRADGSHRRVVLAAKPGVSACRDLDWVR